MKQETHNMQSTIHGRAAVRSGLGWMIAAIAATMLFACVTAAPVKPTPKPPEPPVSAESKTPAVVRLDNGRHGFVITENPEMSAEARSDFDRAVKMLNNQEYKKAIALLEKVIEQSPGVTAPYINLGIAYQHIEKPEKAEAQFKTALELVPGHPVICNAYGLLCRKSGRFDEARAIYQQALEAFPDYFPVHRNLGILCDLYLNDLDCALEHYEIYSRATPEDKQVKLWIADLRARLGK